MLEVFICFHSEDQAVNVLDTAERWRKTKGAYPTVIQVPKDGFELKRRVLADKLSKSDVYIVCDILCVPAMPKFIETIEKRLDETIGMVGVLDRDATEFEPYPSGIRICRKGVVEKWPTQTTDKYNQEHSAAVKQAGKKVELWPDIIYFTLRPKKFKKSHATIH